MRTRISVKECLNSDSASLRAMSELIFDRIQTLPTNGAMFDLDFSEMQFVSRSFAHNLVSWVEEMESKYDIAFTNLSDEISQMIQLVRSSSKDRPASNHRKDIAPSDEDARSERDFLEAL